jgi:transposase
MSVPRFFRNAFPGFEVLDVKEWLSEGRIEIYLQSLQDKPSVCRICREALEGGRGKHRMRLEGMPVMGLRLYVCFWRDKGHCSRCQKARSEWVEFVAEETPHLTQEYAWWLGRVCEIASISRVAELMGQDETTTWRVDLRRMQRMLKSYRIPELRAISVDEVYARKKPKHKGESRDQRFFTVISDLNSRRVVWVSEGRSKEALDQFFILIGKDACSKIEVVAADQYEGYASSAKEYCPKSVLVWDRFHVMKIFEEAVNDTRKQLHEELGSSELAKLTRGKYRFLFLKKAVRRTQEEKTHIDDVLKNNEYFAKLELVKERMITFFDQPDESSAKSVFEEVGEWIFQAGFLPLIDWHRKLERGWDTLKNYFRYRVTSALSEGQNNVIKMLKRRAFGYRNMEYFRLKIMQVCGYLNSRYIPDVKSMTYT